VSAIASGSTRANRLRAIFGDIVLAQDGPTVGGVKRITIGVAVGLCIAGAWLESTHSVAASSVTATENRIQQKIGQQLAIAGIYLEESGVPMPVPSEVSIGYLGQRVGRNPIALLATWLGLTGLIVLGATNVFAASRRFGPRLVSGRVGRSLHLTRERVDRAEQWLHRWGPLAIIGSRYVPGLRWAMAVACGSLRIPYRTFWLSTAISASIWSGLLLTAGVTFGDAIGRFVLAHAWIGLLLPLPAALVLGTLLVPLGFRRRAAGFPTAAPTPSLRQAAAGRIQVRRPTANASAPLPKTSAARPTSQPRTGINVTTARMKSPPSKASAS
jgi:membrane protein DedA with SNARE-associated domain